MGRGGRLVREYRRGLAEVIGALANRVSLTADEKRPHINSMTTKIPKKREKSTQKFTLTKTVDVNECLVSVNYPTAATKNVTGPIGVLS